MKDLIEIIKANEFTAFYGLITGLIVWILSQIKSIKEIARLSKENIELEIKIQKEFVQYEKQFNEKSKELLTLVEDLKESPSIDVKTKWIKVRDFLLIEWVDSFYELVQAHKLYINIFKKKKKEVIDFIEDDILPFLETLYLVKKFINQDKYIKTVGVKKINISPQTINFAYKYILRGLPLFNLKTRIKAQRLYKKIVA